MRAKTFPARTRGEGEAAARRPLKSRAKSFPRGTNTGLLVSARLHVRANELSLPSSVAHGLLFLNTFCAALFFGERTAAATPARTGHFEKFRRSGLGPFEEPSGECVFG